MNQVLIFQKEQRTAFLTLNRPEKKNALNPALIQALISALEEAEKDDSIRVIVLKAAGDVFSAGADLAYLEQINQNTYTENLADSLALKELYEKLLFIGKPVVAQVEGHAIAGGCGIISACDFVYAVPEAKFGYTEVKLGFIPALVSCLLVKKLGDTLVKKLLLTGDLFSAADALQYNLITAISPAHEINQNVLALCEKLAHHTSANSLKETKFLINQVTFNGIQEMLLAAAELNAQVRNTPDFKKGIQSFLKKEKLNW
ncbi:MAG: enoyl-CoA hydratase/isomerase family protein [Pedobacter sp.]|nr:MAG: enoyl-CoA hydratase/isomerase family protein [Pedobacter sp.]